MFRFVDNVLMFVSSKLLHPVVLKGCEKKSKKTCNPTRYPIISARPYSSYKKAVSSNLIDSMNTIKSPVFQNYVDPPDMLELENGSQRDNDELKLPNEAPKGDLEIFNKPDQTRILNVVNSSSIQLVSLGGAIGTGLLIGSGKSLAAGPVPMLVGYSVTSCFVFLMCQALGELTVTLPLNGGFTNYSSRLIGTCWGFTAAWNYGIQWATLFPMQLVAARVTVDYWSTECPVMLIMFALVFFVNLKGAKAYFVLQATCSAVKLIAIALFSIVAIGVNMGAFNDPIGFKYWKSPGMVSDQGLLGLFVCITTSVFSFAGTELIGMTASEQEHPEQVIPRAIRRISRRTITVSLVTVFILSLSVAYDNPDLIGSGGTDSSPFVIALGEIGSNGTAAHLMNGVILVAVVSLGISSVYAASRTLVALAENRHAPAFFAITDTNGTPYYSVIAVSLVGISAAILEFWPQLQDRIIFFLITFGGVSVLVSYLTICLCHLRLRKLLCDWNIECTRLYFQAQLGIWGSVLAVIMAPLLLILQPVIPFLKNKSEFSYTTMAEHCVGIFIIAALFLARLVYSLVFHRGLQNNPIKLEHLCLQERN